MSVHLGTTALLVVLLSIFKFSSGSVMSPGFENRQQKITDSSVQLYVVYLGALPRGSTSDEIVSSHVELLSFLKRR